VLSHKLQIQAKTRPPPEDWFKCELPAHLVYLQKQGSKNAISSANTEINGMFYDYTPCLCP
jgi:hypothetical protein